MGQRSIYAAAIACVAVVPYGGCVLEQNAGQRVGSSNSDGTDEPGVVSRGHRPTPAKPNVGPKPSLVGEVDEQWARIGTSTMSLASDIGLKAEIGEDFVRVFKDDEVFAASDIDAFQISGEAQVFVALAPVLALESNSSASSASSDSVVIQRKQRVEIGEEAIIDSPVTLTVEDHSGNEIASALVSPPLPSAEIHQLGELTFIITSGAKLQVTRLDGDGGFRQDVVDVESQGVDFERTLNGDIYRFERLDSVVALQAVMPDGDVDEQIVPAKDVEPEDMVYALQNEIAQRRVEVETLRSKKNDLKELRRERARERSEYKQRRSEVEADKNLHPEDRRDLVYELSLEINDINEEIEMLGNELAHLKATIGPMQAELRILRHEWKKLRKARNLN